MLSLGIREIAQVLRISFALPEDLWAQFSEPTGKLQLYKTSSRGADLFWPPCLEQNTHTHKIKRSKALKQSKTKKQLMLA